MILKEIIEQFEKCGFVDVEGHPLENNIMFINLKNRATVEDEIIGCVAWEDGLGRELELCKHCQNLPLNDRCRKVNSEGNGVYIRRYEKLDRSCRVPAIPHE